MFWKLVFGLGICGFVVSIIFIVISVRSFYGSNFQSDNEDLAFAGLLISVILFVVFFLMSAVGAIFVMRNSKKEWEAENLK